VPLALSSWFKSALLTNRNLTKSRNPLKQAARIGEKDASQINATDDQGRAPLHEASLNGHLDLVE
jgi:ankyrin repeat protein